MPPAAMTPEKQTALTWLSQNAAALSQDHMTIWHMHEPAWREYRSAAWYVERLRKEGFTVEEGSGGMPTAFCATWSNGDGPTIGGYAEYDAVPGRSQDPVPFPKPRDGVSPYAAGHTDPHSALGMGSFAGFLAAKHAMEAHGIKGRLKFFGEPAEKMCGSKPVHAAKGYYDDLDAAISFHPGSHPAMANSCFWDTHCAPYWSRIYTFECPSPETWAGESSAVGMNHSHGLARAPGAIDAVCLMYTSGKYMKEAMLPHVGNWSLNEYILNAGQAAADNLAPNISQIQYSIRAPLTAMCEKAFEVLDNNAEHVAQMTHCTVRKEWITRTRAGLPNHVMADVTFRNFELVGPPKWNDAAREFSREIQRNLGLEPMQDPIAQEIQRLSEPREAEQRVMRAQLPPWQVNYGADDYVDYTWHAPTVRLFVGRPALESPRPGYRYPEWVRNAIGGVPDIIDPMWMKAGEVIGLTIVDLLKDRSLLDAAQAEFRERTGGGIGGTKWVAPLLPRDFAAPVNYRWPEYVTTARGTGWTIPVAG